MIKKKILSLNTLFVLFVLGFVIFLQGPVWISNYQHESTKLNTQDHTRYPSSKTSFPTPSRSLIIFWSSTCAPCKLEMWRLKNAIENGDIKEEQIYAINTYENDQEILRFIKKNDYPFQFINNQNITQTLNIKATPTIVLLDKNKVVHITTGLNIIGLWYSQLFLSGHF